LSTERPEAVKAGFARLVGVEKDSTLKAMEQALNQGSRVPKISPNEDRGVAQK